MTHMTCSMPLACQPSRQITAGEFHVAVYHPIPDEIMQIMQQYSLAKDCPMKDCHLVYLRLNHRNMQYKEQQGDLVVNIRLIDQISRVFHGLWERRFPVEKMHLIDNYYADDELSMADNNSSGLCQRAKTGQVVESFENWSKHSFGIAVDINPLPNPYVKGALVLPHNAVRYVDRSLHEAGMIYDNDDCCSAFYENGFIWGGLWDTRQDYQHFEVSEEIFQNLQTEWV